MHVIHFLVIKIHLYLCHRAMNPARAICFLAILYKEMLHEPLIELLGHYRSDVDMTIVITRKTRTAQLKQI